MAFHYQRIGKNHQAVKCKQLACASVRECPLRLLLAAMSTAQDDAAMARGLARRRWAAADGRTLTIAECGDPDGFPVFFLHGTPGSRFAGQGFASAYASVGARVVTYDRPGYGRSDRLRGRRVVDCVADVSSIADSLGLERFAVTGVSFGGPHRYRHCGKASTGKNQVATGIVSEDRAHEMVGSRSLQTKR